MIEKKMDDNELESVFDAAKETASLPSSDLMSQVMRDAMAVQAGFAVPPVEARPRGIWQELFRVLGGWPTMAGLATAAVAGVWIGAFPPGFLPDLQAAYLGADDAAYLIDTAADGGFDLVEEAI
ncbi:hypothetical protein [Roseovarius aestuarii]|uniref:Dihydroorotate dehydrogenase n=1 Tax=Roseovarius aestuarii TaxID=475083 RepID=A0A1X7BN20_9RHOB|nr:hypothetical protein [Roseovarius aestuarii]SMC10991.1 hypothetical protein ROA7745_00800 [Roseovarius aestuarii]